MKITTSTQEVFKALRREGAGLYSLVPSPWALKYEPGVVTKPREGFLYAFSSLGPACEHVKSLSLSIPIDYHVEIEIWRAEAEVLNLDPERPYFLDIAEDPAVLRIFWFRVMEGIETGDPNKGFLSYNCPPTYPVAIRCGPGIVWCKWIKLEAPLWPRCGNAADVEDEFESAVLAKSDSIDEVEITHEV